MALGGPGPDGYGQAVPGPLPPRSGKLAKVWGMLEVEGDMVVVRLEGWRVLWATKKTLRVPLSAVTAVEHDPLVYQRVSTRLRRRSRWLRSGSLFKVGAYHGLDGWSFWACGMARNAVVVETSGTRYRFVVVEVADPAAVVGALREAAGIAPAPPPKVRSIRDAPRKRRFDPPGAVRLTKPQSEPDVAQAEPDVAQGHTAGGEPGAADPDAPDAHQEVRRPLSDTSKDPDPA